MRLQDKRSFRAINFDDADEFLEDGDTRSMSNVRVGYAENGDDGIITNVKGTISLFAELSFFLPGGRNKCVGTCTDDQNNRLIWLNWNQYANHAIYCYNADLNTIETVLASSVLNFSGAIIHSIDILNNNLAWVDENRPRAINVTHALAGVYAGATIEELINDAKLVPMFPPVCTPEVTRGSTYIKTLRSFQFIYRYVFIDGEKGVFSTVSKLVATGFRDEHINKITLDVSACEIFTKPAIRPVVTYIEFASRELYTFNFNQFLRITTADLVAAGGIIDYFDTESKTPIDVAETDVSFSENPIKAGTVAFQNDRKFYADCTEGYDAFSLSTSNVSTEVIPQEGGIPYLSDCDTHANERYLKPDSTYGYSAEWHDKYGRKSGAMYLPDLVINTAPQDGNDYKANVLNFDINLSAPGTHPVWAEKIEILRSDNQSVTWFAQGRVNNVFYCTGYDPSTGNPMYILVDGHNPRVGHSNTTDALAMEIHVDIGNWSLYGTNIGYTWTEGDRITFFTLGGVSDAAAPNTLRSLKIKELRGSLLIIDYPLMGRTKLRDIAMSYNTITFNESFASIIITQQIRFIVGDNGVALYSPQQNQDPTAIEDNFNNVAIIPGLSTANNLYTVRAIHDTSASPDPVISVYVAGANGFFAKGTVVSGNTSIRPLPTLVWTNFVQITTGITDDINCITGDFGDRDPANNNYLVLVGNSGKILSYNIATGAITHQTSGTTENLNSVFRLRGTPDTITAVGDGGTILMSRDNGTTWTTKSLSPSLCQNLNSVYLNGVNGCIVGDEGVILISNNVTSVGAAWTRLEGVSKVNFYSVDGEGSTIGRAYIGGEDGYVADISMLTGGHIGGEYNSGTNKDVYRLFSYQSPVSTDRAFICGDRDLLLDVEFSSHTFTDDSSFVSALYGSLILNYKAKVELFSPKTTPGPVIYYEVGDAHPVGQNYSFHKGKGNDGDVFLIKKDFQGNTDFGNIDSPGDGIWTAKGEYIFSMTPDSNNTTGVWDKDFGRPNVVLLYPEVQQRRNIIRQSDKYVQDSKINGLSNFQEANYEIVPNEFGITRKITPIETVLLINGERSAATAHIDQTMFTQANGQQVAALSSKVINNIRRLAKGFGCLNPESVTQYLGQVYWYSSNKSAVCRYNNYNGEFAISDYKARTYYYKLNNGINPSSLLIGGFEPKFKNYLLTNRLVQASQEDIADNFYEIETGKIQAENGPWFSAVSPVNQCLYVVDKSANNISVIDTTSNVKIADIAVGNTPNFILASRGFIYVTNNADNTVSVIDPLTNSVVTTISVGSSPASIGTNADQSKVYVCSQFSMTVTVISTATNTISSVISVTTNPRWCVVAPNGNVYAGGFQDNKIAVINGNNDTFTGTITVGYDPYFLFLVNGYLYSVDQGLNGPGQTLSQIDFNTNTVVSTIELTGSSVPYWLSYNPNNKSIYVTDRINNTILVVSCETNTLIATIPSSGLNPFFSVFSDLHDYVFVTNNGSGTIDVIDSRTNTIIETLTADTGAHFAIRSLNGNLYFSNNGSNTVTYLSYKRYPETLAFQEPSNRWICKYDYMVEKYGTIKTDLFSFKDGELWKHDASAVHNNFHGTQYNSKINPVFNREPNSQKNYSSISLESQKVWSAISITTPEGQRSVLSGNHFEQINKEWWADIKQDINTPNMSGDNALFNGDFMQSNVLNVVLESTLSDSTKLRFVNLYSNINERTNK